MILDEIFEANLLLRGKCSKLQADLAHFDRAEIEKLFNLMNLIPGSELRLTKLSFLTNHTSLIQIYELIAQCETEDKTYRERRKKQMSTLIPPHGGKGLT